MGPTKYLPAYCCARQGCSGYRYVHAAVANAETLVCSICGDAFPTETWMIPEPRRPPRDAAARGSSAAASSSAARGRASKGNAKGKGKGNGQKGYGEGTTKGRGKGSHSKSDQGGTVLSDEAFPRLPRTAAKAKAKPKASASTAPWARSAAAPPSRIEFDPRRKENDPTYPAVINLLVAKHFGHGADIEKAEEELERQRALQEAALPPDKRLAVLRKKLRTAEASVEKFEVRVDEISKELDDAADRLHEARLGLQAQQARTEAIQNDIAATEKLIEAPAGRTALKPGLVGALPRAPKQLGEFLAGIQEFFTAEFELSDHSTSQLASYLQGVASLESNLLKVRAINAAEKAASEDRTKTAKRERPPDADDMADVAGTPTLVADSDPDEEAPRALRTLQEKTADRLQAVASSTTPAPAATSMLGPLACSDATPPAPSPRPVGPLGTTPYAAQMQASTVAAPTAAASQGRADRERSPRREAAATTTDAHADAEETPQLLAEQVAAAAQPCDTLDSLDSETPQLTAAQSAALRGDSVGSCEDLPELEEVVPPMPPQTPQSQAINARGGVPLA